MSKFPNSYTGPVGPTGPTAYDASLENSLALLAKDLTDSPVCIRDIYIDSFSTADGIDSDSSVYYDSKSKCVSPISSKSTAVFPLDLTSDSGWDCLVIQGSIVYWVLDSGSWGHFEGPDKLLYGSATDKGNGKVGLSCNEHGISAGRIISIYGSNYYNGTYTVENETTVNEIVIRSPYQPETFSGAVVRLHISVGNNTDHPAVGVGVSISVGGSSAYILSVTGDGSGKSQIELSSSMPTGKVSRVSQVSFGKSLSPNIYTYKNFNYREIVRKVRPPQRLQSSMDYCSSDGCVYLFGGRSDSVVRGDLWKLDTKTETWTEIISSTSPTARFGHTFSYDPESNCFWLFGGSSSNSLLADLWKYSVASQTWTQMSPSGSPPPARFSHSAAFDPYSNILIIVGGITSSGPSETVWFYSTSNNTWYSSSYSTTVFPSVPGSVTVFDFGTNCFLSYRTKSGSAFFCFTNRNMGRWLSFNPKSIVSGSHIGQISFLDPFTRSFTVFGGLFNNQVSSKLFTIFIDDEFLDYSISSVPIKSYQLSCFDLKNSRAVLYEGLGNIPETVPTLAILQVYRTVVLDKPITLFTKNQNTLSLKGVSSLSCIRISHSIPYKALIAYAVSFDMSKTWKIWKNSTWVDIVRFFNNSWQYLSGSGSWNNASSLRDALDQAWLVPGNLWTEDFSIRGVDNYSKQNALPTMTSNTTPSPYVTTASSELSGYQAWKAFNKTSGDYWSSSSGQVTNQWIQIDLGSGNGFAVNKWRWMSHDLNYNPKRFKLQGSLNGTEWIDLDVQYSNTDYRQISSGAYSDWFTFDNFVPYRYYRMYILSSYSTSNIRIAEIELVKPEGIKLPGPSCLNASCFLSSNGFSPGTSSAFDLAVRLSPSVYGVPSISSCTVEYVTSRSDFTYISKSWTSSKMNPSFAYCVLLIETPDFLVLNTDMKVWISTDDGNNYDQITNLSIVFSFGNRMLIRGEKSDLPPRNSDKVKLKVSTYRGVSVSLFSVVCGVR